MSIDTKLREAADSIREARARAEFTVVPPGDRRPGSRGPRVAAAVGLFTLILIGIPALVSTFGTADSQLGGAGSSDQVSNSTDPTQQTAPIGATTTVGFAEDQGAEPVAPPDDFPFLAMVAPGWNPTYAQETTFENGGFTAELNYEYMTEDGSGGVIVLRVHDASAPFDRFNDLQSHSASSETVAVAGREMTIHHVPKEAIPEDSDSDAYAVSWLESAGVHGFVIAFGLERQELLDALAGIEAIPPEAWLELILVSQQGSPATTTTIVGPEIDTP